MLFPTLYVSSFSAYVAIYHADGSIAVAHGGVEIGQGINTKLVQVVAHVFGIPLDMISVTSHSSVIMANRTLTGATITSKPTKLGFEENNCSLRLMYIYCR